MTDLRRHSEPEHDFLHNATSLGHDSIMAQCCMQGRRRDDKTRSRGDELVHVEAVVLVYFSADERLPCAHSFVHFALPYACPSTFPAETSTPSCQITFSLCRLVFPNPSCMLKYKSSRFVPHFAVKHRRCRRLATLPGMQYLTCTRTTCYGVEAMHSRLPPRARASLCAHRRCDSAPPGQAEIQVLF